MAHVRLLRVVAMAAATCCVHVGSRAQAAADSGKSGTPLVEQRTAQPSVAVAIGQQVSLLEAELARLEAVCRASEAALAAADARFRAGTATEAELAGARSEVEQNNAVYVAARIRLRAARRLQSLTRPVDVECLEASLPQAVEALQKATGLSITAVSAGSGFGAGPPGMGGRAEKGERLSRLSVKARSTPLAAVLETIAEAWGLVIAPEGPDGIVLRPRPAVEVNGKPQTLRAPGAPWAEEWGIPAESGYYAPSNPLATRPWERLLAPAPVGIALEDQPGAAQLVEPAGAAPPGQASKPPAPPSVAQPTSELDTFLSQYGAPLSEAANVGVPLRGQEAPTIALARDKADRVVLVVAEPVVGKQEPGCWLTLYTVDPVKGQFRRVGTGMLHRLASAGPTSTKQGSTLPEERITLTVPLKYAPADTLIWKLTPPRMAPPTVRLQPDVKRNAIIVSGDPRSVCSVVELIRQWDVPAEGPQQRQRTAGPRPNGNEGGGRSGGMGGPSGGPATGGGRSGGMGGPGGDRVPGGGRSGGMGGPSGGPEAGGGRPGGMGAPSGGPAPDGGRSGGMGGPGEGPGPIDVSDTTWDSSDTKWGSPLEGLQAGVRLASGATRVRVGDRVKLEVVLRNTTDHGIDFAWANNQGHYGWRARRSGKARIFEIAPRYRYWQEEHLLPPVAGATVLRIGPQSEFAIPMEGPEVVITDSGAATLAASRGGSLVVGEPRDPKGDPCVILAGPGDTIRLRVLPITAAARGEEWLDRLETGEIILRVVGPETVAPALPAGTARGGMPSGIARGPGREVQQRCVAAGGSELAAPPYWGSQLPGGLMTRSSAAPRTQPARQQPGQQVSVASTGDRCIVVSEPATEGGVRGLLLTVYSCAKDAEVTPLTTRFHKLRQQDAPADPAAAKGRGWGPEQATGVPDTFHAGDLTTAWASQTADGQDEWLLVEFARPVVPARLRVVETYNPGAVNKVTVFTAQGREAVAWSGQDPTRPDMGWGVSVIPMKVDVPIQRVKLYLSSREIRGWNEIDAVGLDDTSGLTQWAVGATASSTYADSAGRFRDPDTTIIESTRNIQSSSRTLGESVGLHSDQVRADGPPVCSIGEIPEQLTGGSRTPGQGTPAAPTDIAWGRGRAVQAGLRLASRYGHPDQHTGLYVFAVYVRNVAKRALTVSCPSFPGLSVPSDGTSYTTLMQSTNVYCTPHVRKANGEPVQVRVRPGKERRTFSLGPGQVVEVSRWMLRTMNAASGQPTAVERTLVALVRPGRHEAACDVNVTWPGATGTSATLPTGSVGFEVTAADLAPPLTRSAPPSRRTDR